MGKRGKKETEQREGGKRRKTSPAMRMERKGLIRAHSTRPNYLIWGEDNKEERERERVSRGIHTHTKDRREGLICTYVRAGGEKFPARVCAAREREEMGRSDFSIRVRASSIE